MRPSAAADLWPERQAPQTAFRVKDRTDVADSHGVPFAAHVIRNRAAATVQ